MEDVHNAVFAELKANRYRYSPGPELEELVSNLNKLDFLYIEDAHRSSCETYEDMKKDDEIFRKKNPDSVAYPPFPENCTVPLTESMCRFYCGYIYFIIKKDENGDEFLTKLEELLNRNESCFTVPRNYFRAPDELDEKYAFVVELQNPKMKSPFPHFAIFDYSEAKESMVHEKIFFSQLTELAEKTWAKASLRTTPY